MEEPMDLGSIDSIHKYLDILREHDCFADDEIISKAVNQCKEAFKALDCRLADKLAALKEWGDLLHRTDQDELYQHCVSSLTAPAGLSCVDKLSTLKAWREAGLWPQQDWPSYQAFQQAGRDLLEIRLRLFGTPSAAAPSTPQGPAAGNAPTPAAAGHADAGCDDVPVTPNAAGGHNDTHAAPMAVESLPLTVTELYETANRAITPLVKLERSALRDERYKQTVDRVPFQEEAIRLIIANEKQPQRILVDRSGQQVSLQLPSAIMLGDEMGLGKTLVAVGAIVGNPREQGQLGTLVLLPAVVAGQWMAEIKTHSNLTVLNYTGLARHASAQLEFCSSDSKGERYEALTPQALKKQWKKAQAQAETNARAQGKTAREAAEAKRAVKLAPFSSLRPAFSDMLKRYDVIIMSFEDAELESAYLSPAPRSTGRTASQRAETYLQSPLVQIGTFKRLIIDECHRITKTDSNVGRLVMAIKAEHRLLMSGTPFPAGREVPALTAALEILFSGSSNSTAGGGYPQLEDGWLPSLVKQAMQSCGDWQATGDAKQALKQLISALMIRRTRGDVRQQYNVPPQRHVTKVVPAKYSCGFIQQLLLTAGRRAFDDVPAGEELPAKLVHHLYDRLVGVSSHPQHDRLIHGGAQLLDTYGVYTDAHSLPIRTGKVTHVSAQFDIAVTISDSAKSYMLKLAAEAAGVAHQLAAQLSSKSRQGGPDVAGARQVIEEVLSLLQSGLPIFTDGTTEPRSYMDLGDHTCWDGERLPPFHGQVKAKQAYEAACQDFNTNFGHLKGLRARLSAPNRAAETGSSSTAAELNASSGSALLRSRLASASQRLQQRLSDLQDHTPEGNLMEQLGGSEEQLQEIFASAETKLSAQEVHEWFVKLKHQRQVVLGAVAQLRFEPSADSYGLVPATAVSRYSAELSFATCAMHSYRGCYQVKGLLRKGGGDVNKLLQKYSGVYSMQHILTSMACLPMEQQHKETISDWVAVLDCLDKEKAAAHQVIAVAQEVLTAAKKLAPRDTAKGADELQDDLSILTAEIQDLDRSIRNEIKELLQQTAELERTAAAEPKSCVAAEHQFGSLLGELADMLLKVKALKPAGSVKWKEQVVVVVANKVLYWDLLIMLAELGLPFDHLDAEELVARKSGPGFTNKKRVQGRGLDNFKKGNTVVMVLHVLDARQACGITLTNAARMIVLDPVLDESTLHQLLSRIHRYGQKREQEVTFLVTQDSMNELLQKKFVVPIAKKFNDQGGQADLPDEAAAAAAAAGDAHSDDEDDVDAADDELLATLSSSYSGKRAAAQDVPQHEMLQLLKQLLKC